MNLSIVTMSAYVAGPASRLKVLGQMHMRRQAGMLLLAGLLCVLGGCITQKNPYERFLADDPSVRIQAMISAGDSKDANTVPYIVENLANHSPEVRFFAILSLEKITGQRLGYEYYLPRKERIEAVERWRQYLREKGLTPASAPATAPSRR